MIEKIIEKYKSLVESKKLVIVYLYSKECVKTNKIFNSLKKNNNILFLNYDVEDINNKCLLKYLDLKCYPYFYIYKNGKLIDQILGTLKIEKILNQYLSI